MKFIKVLVEDGIKVTGLVDEPSITKEMVEDGAKDEIFELAQSLCHGTDTRPELLTVEQVRELIENLSKVADTIEFFGMGINRKK
jgi:hypothetical protein